MIEWERRVRLRHYLDEGYSQTVIAELLGTSRRTIYAGSRAESWTGTWRSRPGMGGRRPQRPRKLDPNTCASDSRITLT